MMKRKTTLVVKILIAFFLSNALISCSYNPFITNNHETGNPVGAAIGAAIGGGSIALLGGHRGPIALASIAGGAIGYYVTTLRYVSGGVIQGGGQVYKLGDFIGIYIPSDNLFEPNTINFLPAAYPILDSAVAILARYPENNILVSGSTSGFYYSWWERRLSERRAQKVSAYLWQAGINNFSKRKLNYVGFNNYFPISSTVTNKGIRENSRIQITSYPSDCDLLYGRRESAPPCNLAQLR